MAVNAKAWRSFPVAARDQGFKADDAIKRIQELTRGSIAHFNTGFLWRDSNGPPNNKNSYRLPIADVINGRMTLVPHAVFTAAAILSGAHGGLEGVVGEEEKGQLRTVVGEIYKMLQDTYKDPRIVPPWEREDVPPDQRPNRRVNPDEPATAALTAAVNSGVASLPLADKSRSWDGSGARSRLWSWAGGDFRKYRKGFLWWDSSAPEAKGSYKLPVADIIDGKLTLVPRAVNAVAAVIEGARGGVDIPDADIGRIRALVNRMQGRFDSESGEDEPMAAAVTDLVRPPSEWFDRPQLDGPTRLTVTPEGQVYGHLALWNTCHMGIRDTCRMAPRSTTGYRYFMDGSVITADGRERPVGKITMGTGHASLNLGYVPAADHYDNTGTVVAIVAAYEDQWGPVVAGAAVPEATEQQLAVLRRSPLSGDWRPTPQGLELVAALAVNSPGFPVVGFTASGDVATLIAAGMVLTDEEKEALGELSGPDKALLERLEAFQRKAAQMTQSSRRRRLDAVLATMGGVPDGV